MVTERHPRVTATRPKILVTRRLPEAVEQRMATLFEARFNPADAPYSADALVAALAGSDVLVSSITDRIDIDLISRLPESVKLIAQFGNLGDSCSIDTSSLNTTHWAGTAKAMLGGDIESSGPVLHSAEIEWDFPFTPQDH